MLAARAGHALQKIVPAHFGDIHRHSGFPAQASRAIRTVMNHGESRLELRVIVPEDVLANPKVAHG